MSDTWTTRSEVDADVAVVHEINATAFDTDEEANLVDRLRRDPHWIPDLSIVATDDAGTVVGFALLTRCHIGDIPALCLAPCAVLPSRQRTGAGGAAIRAGLDRARTMGERYIVVLGHASYYPRFGFVRAGDFGISLPVDVPDDSLMALSLDESALPGGQVSYAEPFGI